MCSPPPLVLGVGAIAGSVDTRHLVVTGQASWTGYVFGFLVPSLIGNVIGGVTIVAAMSHAQVVAGRELQSSD